jgi:4-amino-4-deoxy-L-arabinose transferase-like glycosyltransferase
MMITLLQDILADLTKRKDSTTILGITALIIALSVLLFGASRIAIVNFIMIINLVLVGWIFRAGWSARQKGEKPKLLLIAGIALGICILQAWQLSVGLAQLAEFADKVKDFQRLIEK